MERLRITILGTGDMGAALATALSERTSHLLAVRGSRPGSASATHLVNLLEIKEATDSDIEESDIVFVAIPPEMIPVVVPILKPCKGILISVVVSRTVAQDGLPSSAEVIAAALPGCRVVNAFTSMWAAVVRNPGGAAKTSVFVCSDDDDARALVSELAVTLGFEAINGGKLSSAIFTEAMGMFAVRLALDSGYGQTISFRAFQAGARVT